MGLVKGVVYRDGKARQVLAERFNIHGHLEVGVEVGIHFCAGPWWRGGDGSVAGHEPGLDGEFIAGVERSGGGIVDFDIEGISDVDLAAEDAGSELQVGITMGRPTDPTSEGAKIEAN